MFSFSISLKSVVFAIVMVLILYSPVLADDLEPSSEFDKGAVFLTADEMFKDTNEKVLRYIARGNVEARYQNRILRADQVIYFPELNKVRAIGSVVVVEEDGTVSFADEVELDDNLTTGVATGFFARLGNQGQIGAVNVIHFDNGRRNKLKKAFYTACESCKNEDGSFDKPTWRLRAREAEQNHDDKMIYYRDAVFELKGVPILYSPFFAHADPTAGRRTGLLFPSVGHSAKFGWFYEQPYYKVIDRYSDITITPKIFTGKRPLVSANYRKRYFSGSLHLQGGATHEQDFDGDGVRFGDGKFRGYVLGSGKFQINPNWHWGFGVEGVSDDLFFQRYDIDFETNVRGLFRNSSNRLSNQLFAVRQTNDFYGSIAGIRYQGLRAGDNDQTLPVAGPLIDAKKVLSNNILGGKLTFNINTAVLHRAQGIDSRRASSVFAWSRRFVSKNGIIAKPFALARADVYSITNQNFMADLGTDTQSLARVLGVAGAEIRWPWLKVGKNVNWIVEPIAHLSASPNGDGVGTFDVITTDNFGNTIRTPTSLIPNEDSVTVDFDESNLFRSTRFAGYDLWEDGLRASIGGRVSARWGQEGYATFTAGRAFRSSVNTGYSAGSSLRGKSSDYVAGLTFSTGNSLKLASNIRLDQDDFGVSRFDIFATSRLTKSELGPLQSFLYSLNAAVRYSNIPASSTGGVAIDEVTTSGQMFFNKNWGLQFNNVYDLDSKEHRQSTFGLIYDDNCSRFELIYQRDNIVDRTLTSGDAIRFRFTLTTLGSFGD